MNVPTCPVANAECLPRVWRRGVGALARAVGPSVPLLAGWCLLLAVPFVAAIPWGQSATLAALVDAACNGLLLWILWPLLWLGRKGYLAGAMVLWVLGLPIAFFYAWFGRHCVADTFVVLHETDWQDVAAFLRDRSWNYWSIAPYPVCGLVPLLLAVWVAKKVADWRRARRATGALLAIYSAGLLAAMGPAEIQSRSLPAIAFYAYCQHWQESRQYQHLASLRPDQIEEVRADGAWPGRENIVVILGESTSRWHMSLYGYGRPTNPELEKLAREDEGCIVYRDVLTPHTYTHNVYRELFTWADRWGDHAFYRRGDLVQYLQKAGYRVYWLQGHAHEGLAYDCFSSLLAAGCDRLICARTTGNPKEDGCLLAPLASLLEEPGKKVIFVETVGSHEVYEDRYPKEFEHFALDLPVAGRTATQARVINGYDNAVRYVDHTIASMIASVRKAGGYAAVVYFSDHGEDVFDNCDRYLSHEEVAATRAMYEVPLIFWLSADYRRCRPAKAAALRANCRRKYMTDQLMHTLLDMIGVQCDSLDPRLSLASDRYTETPRLVGRIDYDRDGPRSAIFLKQP